MYDVLSSTLRSMSIWISMSFNSLAKTFQDSLGMLLSISLNLLLPEAIDVMISNFHFPLIASNASFIGNNESRQFICSTFSMIFNLDYL